MSVTLFSTYLPELLFITLGIVLLSLVILCIALAKLFSQNKTINRLEQKQFEFIHSFEQFNQMQQHNTERLEKELIRFKETLFEKQAQHHQQVYQQLTQQQQSLSEKLADQKLQTQRENAELKQTMQTDLRQFHQSFDKRQIEGLQQMQTNMQQWMQDVRKQINSSLASSMDNLGKQIDKLTQATNDRLKDISGQVEKRLTEGFEKTTATFTDVLKRLALIDEAQKRITELSSNVVSLQEVLSDKRSRGAFGEVQLNALIRNLLPENNFSLQYQLSNGKRCDCILFLPEPTGNVVIDSKFPLETYQKMVAPDISEIEKRACEQQFRIDIKKHIQDIASKYIIPGETSDGAVMFIPAEAVFAEIHAHYSELVELAHRSRVWLASPTTMMAILTTARAVLKDADTRKQVHVIQEHLGFLAKDFDRFQKRMNNLERHIEQANEDIKDVNTSARKITNRFHKIEKVELDSNELESLDVLESSE